MSTNTLFRLINGRKPIRQPTRGHSNSQMNSKKPINKSFETIKVLGKGAQGTVLLIEDSLGN